MTNTLRRNYKPLPPRTSKAIAEILLDASTGAITYATATQQILLLCKHRLEFTEAMEKLRAATGRQSLAEQQE